MRTMTASVLTALTLAATTGTAVAASQGSLPEPMQQVAHDALGVVGVSVPGIERNDDTKHDDGVEPASVTNDTSGSTTSAGTPTTPSSEPSASTSGEGVAPAASDTTSSDAVTGPENAGGNSTPQGGEGVAGQNPNVGPGNNSGNGNPDPGESNNGNGNGNGERERTAGGDGGTTVDTPANNLPSQSNGKGNGPPAVPPGQAKK